MADQDTLGFTAITNVQRDSHRMNPTRLLKFSIEFLARASAVMPDIHVV